MYDEYYDSYDSNNSADSYSAGGDSYGAGSADSYGQQDSYGASDSYGAGGGSMWGSDGMNRPSDEAPRMQQQQGGFRGSAPQMQAQAPMNDGYGANRGYDYPGANSANDYPNMNAGYGYQPMNAPMQQQGQDMSRELERMIQSVNTSIAAITSRLNQQDATLANIESRLSSQDGTLSGIDSRLSSQDGTLNGIENRLSQQDGTLSNIDNKLTQQAGAPTEQAPNDYKVQLDDISSNIHKLSSDTSAMKDELSEKIHSENVKVYRNLNDSLKESDKGEENKNAIIKKIKGVKTSANLALIFGIFDFAGIGALVYLMLKMTGMI